MEVAFWVVLGVYSPFLRRRRIMVVDRFFGVVFDPC